MVNFHVLDYLQNGNPRQRSAYGILERYNVFAVLSEFAPFLAGTIPIEIDVDESDLDILCHWKDRRKFIDCLVAHFSMMPQFLLSEKRIQEKNTVIASLLLDDMKVEIFGQDIPVCDQFGYRHLMIEHRLLATYGAAFRDEVIRLKKAGLKTEPAFAQLLGLKGDPYLALLTL